MYTPDSSYLKKKTDKAIRFSIIDTIGGATIEWLEYQLLERSDTGSTVGPAEWVPMYRIVYKCDTDGNISSVVNYAEVKAQVDTLINAYISHLASSDVQLSQRIMEGFMDSSWVMTSLLREAELIHRPFGLTFTDLDTLSLVSLQEHSEEWLLPYFMIRTNDPICQEGNVSFRGWGDVGTVDLKSFLNERLGQLDQIDTIAIPQATGREEMTVCIDTLRSLPTYLNMQRRMILDEAELRQRVIIYEDQLMGRE
ncbi:MAG: hypothetical protein JNL52_00990 [Flavobacteriales bacterium]|nr:hypothetical protein [Flavobacteriales bacterium]